MRAAKTGISVFAMTIMSVFTGGTAGSAVFISITGTAVVEAITGFFSAGVQATTNTASAITGYLGSAVRFSHVGSLLFKSFEIDLVGSSKR